MKAPKKIKGFTLIEMLVTLSLSTVVVSFAYMAYNYIFSSYIQYEKMNNEISEFTSCQRQIQKLVNTSDYMEVKPAGPQGGKKQVLFYLKDKPGIKLEFSDSFMVFSNELTSIDSASCVVKTHNCFLGTTVVESGFISRLVIGTEINKKPYNLSFEKLYDAEMMVRLDSLNKFVK